jgi:hypothetical protein
VESAAIGVTSPRSAESFSLMQDVGECIIVNALIDRG